MRLKEALEDKAKKYAEKAHEGQKRKFVDEPYVKHPTRVADIVKRFKDSHKIESLISAALLHDTIEDTDTTEADLHKLFGGLVATLVRELTSSPEGIKEKGKAVYLADKMKSMSSWALVIKLADRLDNVSDLKTATPEFAEKYGGETRRLLKMLKKERAFTNTQQKIVDAIEDKLDELEDHKFNEEFAIGFKRNEEYFEVFSNPSKKEVLSIDDNTARFIVDEKAKKIYVWNAEILHHDVAKKLNISYLEYSDPDFAYGVGGIGDDGRLRMKRCSSLNNELEHQVRSGKHWSKRYFCYLLDEEFVTRIKARDSIRDQIEIFANPSRQELNLIKKHSGSEMMRFIIDNRLNKIYVWDAEVWHKTVAKKLKIPFEVSGYNSIQFGYGQGLFDGKKIDVAYIRSDPKLLRKIKRRGHWSNRWLVGTDEI